MVSTGGDNNGGLGTQTWVVWSGLRPGPGNALFERALLVGDKQEVEDLRRDIWALILEHKAT